MRGEAARHRTLLGICVPDDTIMARAHVHQGLEVCKSAWLS